MEESSGRDGGGHTVQGSVDDATVSRNEIGAVMKNVEKVMGNTLEDNFEIMEDDKMVEDVKPAPLSEKVASKDRKLNARDSGSWKLQDDGDSVPSKKEKTLDECDSKRKPGSEMNNVQHIEDKENMAWAQDNPKEVVARGD
ncbi:hypothetical protein Tco_0262156 [Tanacetum coccineum]